MKRFLPTIPPEELKSWLAEAGQPAFRLAQIRRWIFQPGIRTFDAMKNLPKALRQRLDDAFCLRTITVRLTSGQSDDAAEKFLLELTDGNTVECVLLHNELGEHTLCASTQVGCAMGCVFCASGLGGVVRNLTADEILEQFLLAADHLPNAERLSHAVIMGMGEPTRNLDALLQALEIVTSPEGLNLGARRITISTVGIPQGIERLAASCGHPYHLAVSLHAPNDEIRSQIVPTNRQIGIAKILQAAETFFQQTGRRVTFEYILIDGVNDQPQHARELANRLRGMNALVNLIPYNPVRELSYRTPPAKRVETFARTLEKLGVSCTLRHRKGDDINAACGQLRREYKSDAAERDRLPPIVEGE